MRLMQETRPEDLEVVEYWVKANGKAWPVDDNNDPLNSDGNAFPMDDNGLPTANPIIDPQEAEEFDSTPNLEEIELPELLVFKLRMLLGNDDNQITQALIKIKTQTTRRNRQAKVEQEIDQGAAANLKLSLAIEEWAGILDKDGKLAEITPENVGYLPSWIHGDLTEHVTSMSLIDEEDAGE